MAIKEILQLIPVIYHSCSRTIIIFHILCLNHIKNQLDSLQLPNNLYFLYHNKVKFPKLYTNLIKFIITFTLSISQLTCNDPIHQQLFASLLKKSNLNIKSNPNQIQTSLLKVKERNTFGIAKSLNLFLLTTII